MNWHDFALGFISALGALFFYMLVRDFFDERKRRGKLR